LNQCDNRGEVRGVDYREQTPGPDLDGLIKARWTLTGRGGADQWHAQQATPDGCVELIRRLAGRSRWDGEQPAGFAVGLIERPEPFEISGDASFEALRLWPWAWLMVGDLPLATLRGRWLPFDAPDFDAIEARLAEASELNRVGRAILAADSVADMGALSGMNPRALQRWFAAHVGLPPRRYLRLLRFQRAFETAPGQPSLAGHAAETGFADQAHMAREFRALAGTSAGTARDKARGPFLP
jgi:AraC-like DNA-binding protein